MRRKFSFVSGFQTFAPNCSILADLQRNPQRFGPSKQETAALKQHLAARNQSFDSEPPTPHSVRPPLPPITEAQLKAACTWVVANYRPSHIPHQEPVGIGVSVQSEQHVDYAALNASVRRERQTGFQEAVQWPSEPTDTVMSESSGGQWPSSDTFRYKPSETAKDVFHHHEFEAMREQRSAIMEKAEQLMANLEETQKVLLSPEIRSHTRSRSNQSSLSLPLQETERLPKATPRTDSVGTVTSTPQTDATDGAWVASTAPTTAYVTPASQSKRTSHGQSDSHLPPTVSAVDAEWMRQELEKHLRAQEEDLRRRYSPEPEAAAGLAETTPTQIAHTPASPQSMHRNPVPRRGTGASRNFSIRTDSRQQSKPHSRTESWQDAVPVSPATRPGAQRPHASSQVSLGDASQRNRGRSINCTRPSTAQTAVKAAREAQGPRSRAQSIKGSVQNFSRPSLDTTSRKVSADISRPESRGRSVDSFRSAVSAISSSAESSARKWKSWTPRRSSQDSERSLELADGQTPDSTRGRPRMPRYSPPPPPTPRVNLNRELPPLPGLDQWKPVEFEVAPAVQDGSPHEEPYNERPCTPKSEQRPYPRRQDSLSNRKVKGTTRHQPSVSSSTFQTFPARHSVYLDAQSSQPYEQPLAAINTIDPVASRLSLTSETSHRHTRSRPITEAASPELINNMSQLSLTQSTPSIHSHTFNTTAPAEIRHSRILPAEAPNFSRKLSSDDYSRMYDHRYQNMLEVTPSLSNGSGGSGVAPPVPPKDKRHWWRRGRSRREENWMDAVVKSGSRSGVLLTDEVAGSPIVRY